MVQIKFISPTEGQTILGDKITISFIVSDFAVGQDGYLNLWLDNPSEEASTAAKIVSSFDYTLSDLSPGAHKLTLEAVSSNKPLFNPPIRQTVTFTTTLPQIPTIASSPTPFSILAFVNFNWQYFLVITALGITIIGIAVKSTLGKPKIWK